MSAPPPSLGSLAADAAAPIGQYLIAAQQVTAVQVVSAVRLAYRQGIRIGQALITQGAVSPVALADALVTQSLDRRLAGLPPRFIGELLLAEDAINPDQLAAALYTQLIRQQHGAAVSLSQLLINQGVIDAAHLSAIVAADTDRRAGPLIAPDRPRDYGGLSRRTSLPATALVVEDDPVFATLIAVIIQRQTQFTLRTITRIAEATAAIAAGPPRLLVIDRRLPDGDGLLLAAHVHVQVPDVAIVLMTADTSPALLHLIEAAQIRHYIAKPFAPSAFIRVVHAALGERP